MTTDSYPRYMATAGHGEMIIPESDGTVGTLLLQVQCILRGRGTFGCCPRTGELVIRTGLDVQMGGELVPLDGDD